MKNEKGVVLVLALVMTLCLTIMALARIQSSIFEIKLAGNDLIKAQAFQSSESGWQVARTKLETLDSAPTSPSWTAVESMTNPIHFEAFVSHDLNTDGSVKTFVGKPIYIIESHGYQQQAHQITEVKLVRRPSLDPPGALYSKSNVLLKGTSTWIDGRDHCGVNDKLGVETTASTITPSGNPVVNGSPASTGIGQITDSFRDYPISETISYLKDFAIKHSYASNQTFTDINYGDIQEGATQQDPITPLSDPSIVYYDMNGKDLTLAGQPNRGGGILMVNGNLNLSGGFKWYGILIVTGTVNFIGGGERNITGGVISGGSSELDSTAGGNLTIVYCSKVEEYLENKVPPTKVLSWQHKF